MKPRIFKLFDIWVVELPTCPDLLFPYASWSEALERVQLWYGRQDVLLAIQARVQRQIAAGEIVITDSDGGVIDWSESRISPVAGAVGCPAAVRDGGALATEP